MPPMLWVLQGIFALSNSDDILIHILQEYLSRVIFPIRLFMLRILDVFRVVGVYSFGWVVEEVATGFVKFYWFFGEAFSEFDAEFLY